MLPLMLTWTLGPGRADHTKLSTNTQLAHYPKVGIVPQHAKILIMFRSLVLLVLSVTAWPGLAQQSSEFFEPKVRPILAANCYSCHGAKVHLSGLALSTAAGFGKGGERGALIDRAQIANSLVLSAISYSAELKMPPNG